MEIGGMFRRDAGQNAPLLRHKTKGKSSMMSKFQARRFYTKMFANYPDVLTVEDATNLLGFKSQTGVIRRIHQNRIRYLKVGRNFMIPKEYLIDYLLSDWFHTDYIILHSALLFQCQEAVRFYFFRRGCQEVVTLRRQQKQSSCSGNLKSLVWLNENAEGRESQVWCMWKTFRQIGKRKCQELW